MKIRLFIMFGAATALAAIAPTTYAGTLAWYRFGEDDTYGGGPVAGGAINQTVNSSGTFPTMNYENGQPVYSQSVPGGATYDPISDTALANDWSLFSPGNSASQRVRTPSSQAIPSVFTFETFVRFDDLNDAPTFAYHRSSAVNGWSMDLLANDTIRAAFFTGGTLVNSLTSTTAVTQGEWYHVGLIVTGNSTDGSSDAYLFVNHVNEAAINLNDTASLLSGSAPYYTGNVFAANTVRLDETRYFDHALALDGSQFLRVVPEPSSLALLGGVLPGLMILFCRRHRRGGARLAGGARALH